MEQEEKANAGVELAAATGRLGQATQSLAEALVSINANFEALHTKIDRIVAAVESEETREGASAEGPTIADLEKANQELKAQAARARRKTLSPLVTTLLAKEGAEGDALIESPIVEKALAGLSVEQRIAVKAELARAGVLV